MEKTRLRYSLDTVDTYTFSTFMGISVDRDHYGTRGVDTKRISSMYYVSKSFGWLRDYVTYVCDKSSAATCFLSTTKILEKNQTKTRSYQLQQGKTLD